jgi:hypothetical protein
LDKATYKERERAFYAHGAAMMAVLAFARGDEVEFLELYTEDDDLDTWASNVRILRSVFSDPIGPFEEAVKILAVDVAQTRALKDEVELAEVSWDEFACDWVFADDSYQRVAGCIQDAAQRGEEEECFRVALSEAMGAIELFWEPVHAIALRLAAEDYLDGQKALRMYEEAAPSQ